MEEGEVGWNIGTESKGSMCVQLLQPVGWGYDSIAHHSNSG